MSRGAREYMLQMSAAQFKVLLNVACSKVINVCTFLLGDLRPRWRGIYCPKLCSSAMIFQILDQFETLIPVWKCVEIELHSLSCLNNLARTGFIITSLKWFSAPSSKAWFTIFGCVYIKMLTIPPEIIWKEKERIKSREKLSETAFFLFQQLSNILYICKVSKVGNRRQGWPKSSPFNSNYRNV